MVLFASVAAYCSARLKTGHGEDDWVVMLSGTDDEYRPADDPLLFGSQENDHEERLAKLFGLEL